MLSRIKGRKKAILRGAFVGTLAGIATLAAAQWLTDGVGPGRADAGTWDRAKLVVQAGNGGSQMTPDSPGDLSLAISNPNPTPVVVTSVAEAPSSDPRFTAPTSNSPGCPPSEMSIVPKSGLNITIPANAVGHQVNVSGAARLASNAPDACKNAVFHRSTLVTAQGG